MRNSKVFRLIRVQPGLFRVEELSHTQETDSIKITELSPFVGFPVKLAELGEFPYPVPLLKVRIGGNLAARIDNPDPEDDLIAYLEPEPDVELSAFFACANLEEALQLCTLKA